jgi:acyl-CoA thioester hydrolase
MYKHTIQIRVRYGETDQMGYLYYGNYAEYYEVARTETIRSLGISYKQLEEKGVLLPVISMNIEFLKPAFYDEEITIVTTIPEIPAVRIKFNYELFNSNNDLINKASTTLVFIDAIRNRPCKAPDEVITLLNPHFRHEE